MRGDEKFKARQRDAMMFGPQTTEQMIARMVERQIQEALAPIVSQSRRLDALAKASVATPKTATTDASVKELQGIVIDLLAALRSAGIIAQ